jgi:lipid A 3-O-deacylase
MRIVLSFVGVVVAANIACAADIAPPDVRAPVAVPVATAYDPFTGWEVRAGVFMHGVGNVEKNTYDIDGELILPKLFAPVGPWSYMVPRIHLGANVNTGGRTSAAFAGLLWTLPVFDTRFFVEGFLDAAYHNGSLTGTPTMSAMGCDPLFHVGGSFGYRFDAHWSTMVTFDHLSNGSGIGLTNCGRNQGLNNYGLRIGYQF